MGCGNDVVGVLLAPITGGLSLAVTDVGQDILEDAWRWLKHVLIPDMRRDRESQIQSATNARNIIYGRTRVGGQIAYAETSGSKNETLHIVCIHAGHEIDGYEEIWFNDVRVCTVTNGTTVGTINTPYSGKVSIELFDGTQTAASASLIAASAGGWTSDHKLLGLAYSHITLTYDESVFPAGLPTIKAVVRGKKVLDTRTNVIAWSVNPAMCIRDYMLTSKDFGGMGCDAEEINEPLVITTADICDQQVSSLIPLDIDSNPVTPGVKALYKPVTGSWENRYTINGEIKLDGVPTEFVKSMLSAIAGEAIYSEGMWKVFAGAASSSVTTIDESWLNGGISFQTGSNKNNKNNTVKGIFTNSNDYWSDTEFPEVPVGLSTPPNSSYWSLTASPAKYNTASTYAQNSYALWASKVYKAYSATTVPINTPPPNATYWVLVELHDNSVQYPISHVVQRSGSVYTSTTTVPISNPYLAEDGGEVLSANITLPFTTGSSEAQRLAKIALLKSRNGFSMSYPCNHKAFKLEIMDVITLNNTNMGVSGGLFRVIGWDFSMMGGTNISFIKYDPTIYEWSETDSSPLVSPVITGLPDPWTVATPSGLTATEVLYTTVTTSASKSKLNLAWVGEEASGTLYDIAVDGVIVQSNVSDVVYTLLDVKPGTYDIAVRAKNTLGKASSWLTITKVVAGQDTPPANVSGFTATFAGNLVKLSWTPNTEYDLAGYEIRTGASWAAGTILQAALLGNGYTFRPSASGAVTYWIKAFDTAGNESATAATASATVPAADVPTAMTPISQFLEIDLDITFDTTRQDTLHVEIWAASSNDRNAASSVGISKEKRWKHRDLTNGLVRYYWTRIVTVFGETGAWYPSGATSGVMGSALNDPSQAIKLINSEATQADIDAMLAGTTSLIKVIDTRNMLFELGVVGPGIAATYTEALSQASSEMNKNKNLLEQLNSIVSGLVVTEYDGATAYTVGMIVSYSGDTYQCILDSTGNLPTNTTYWSPISGLYDLVNTIQINLDTLEGTFTVTAATLTADVADLANPTDGRVTLAESTLLVQGNEIVLQGTAITGPLAFVVGAVTEPGVVVETAEDVQGLDTAVSDVQIKLDTANAAIVIGASEIDNLTGRVSQAEIDIDGANGAISLKASQSALDALTGTVATKAAQIDLDSANAAILLRATYDDVSSSITVLSDLVGISLSSPGATYTPGMTLTWSDASHTKSLVRFDISSFQVGNTVATAYSGTRAYLVDELVTYSSNTYRCILPSTGNTPTNTTYWMLATGLAYRPVFSVGNIAGSPAVGISGDLFIDGTVSSRTINTDLLSAKTFIMGNASTTGVIETYNYDAASAGIRITGGATPSIALKGAVISFASGSSGYANISDKPTLGSLAAKSSVDLSTSEVTNKSLANVDSTANTKLGQVGTYIGTDGIYTGTLICENLTGTVITGKTLQTGDGVTTGQIERFVVSASSKAAHFYNSSNVEKVWIGTATGGGLNTYGVFGSLASGESRTALVCLSNSEYGVVGNSISGQGVRALSTSGTGLYAYSNTSYGLICASDGDNKSPFRIMPKSISPNGNVSGDVGALYVTDAGNFYGCQGGTTWVQLN